MTVKRQLGAILLESGRISQTDVDQVLDYQRTHGGFFGQAIVALGILSREEIDWALASQFDLPFIFPNPEAVDRDAAKLVPPDWALTHLAVPIVRAGRTLTVVVANPLDGDVLEDLHTRTGYEVEMALASASRIRELIRVIYGETPSSRTPDTTPVRLTDMMTDALAAGSDRIGISVRGTNATGWYATRNSRERRILIDGWENVLEDMVDPSPFDAANESAPGGMRKYTANLHHAGSDVAVEVQVMKSGAGTEFMLKPTKGGASKKPGGVVLPLSVAAELKLLARVGNARVGLPAGEDDFVRDITPLLPGLVFGDGVRAAHVALKSEVPGIFTLLASDDDDFISTIEAYDFDALSTDLPISDKRFHAIVRTAPITFAYVDNANRAALDDAGINWLLLVSRDQDALAWELRPVNR
jgi:hypothetical protein